MLLPHKSRSEVGCRVDDRGTGHCGFQGERESGERQMSHEVNDIHSTYNGGDEKFAADVLASLNGWSESCAGS